jgi:FdhD protein
MTCTLPHSVTRWQGQQAMTAQDILAVETPIALEFNGISHAVMLATPQELAYFALGFALTEGIIDHADAFYGVEIVSSELGITVQCEIAARAFSQLKQRRRVLMGRSGCGLCGLDNLAQTIMPLSPLAHSQAISAAAIPCAVASLPQFQILNQLTGALHAAAWCDASGKIQDLCEDVGRHNALDKLIGKRVHLDFQAGFLLITSRASIEMVQKAARMGISHLVALSAPTALAVQTAQQIGMTLVAFARADHFVVYTHADKIIEEQTMNMQHLIQMANQIGDFFAAMPDKTEAKQGIVKHIQLFWGPIMRTQLLDYVEQAQGAGLKPLVLAAIQEHRAQLTPVQK